MTRPLPLRQLLRPLPERSFSPVRPRPPVEAPALIALNRPLATASASRFPKTRPKPPVSRRKHPARGTEPLAAGLCRPPVRRLDRRKLGDGRAILLGEVVAPDGARFDIQLKGAGPHPLFPHRRRQGLARPRDARIHRLGSRGRHGACPPPARWPPSPFFNSLNEYPGEPVLREAVMPRRVLDPRRRRSHIRPLFGHLPSNSIKFENPPGSRVPGPRAKTTNRGTARPPRRAGASGATPDHVIDRAIYPDADAPRGPARCRHRRARHPRLLFAQ